MLRGIRRDSEASEECTFVEELFFGIVSSSIRLGVGGHPVLRRISVLQDRPLRVTVRDSEDFEGVNVRRGAVLRKRYGFE